jgi:hypothetical protein
MRTLILDPPPAQLQERSDVLDLDGRRLAGQIDWPQPD